MFVFGTHRWQYVMLVVRLPVCNLYSLLVKFPISSHLILTGFTEQICITFCSAPLFQEREKVKSYGFKTLLTTSCLSKYHLPVNESSLGVHQIKLVIQTSPGFSDGSRIAQHTHSSLHFGQIATWNDSGWLVVDADFETSGTPVNKLKKTRNCQVKTRRNTILALKRARSVNIRN